MLLKRSKNNACFFVVFVKSNQKMSLKVYGASILIFFSCVIPSETHSNADTLAFPSKQSNLERTFTISS